ncbi:hypothetical protein D7316_02095 [Gordonia insulae]|uniref:DUF2889 domain-containing protein n=2 Tax=Gordonia insulae TaxID=2420509 RepID=A0A3G8JM24_9ACTN|nr:hypothetical protein D7316_02095 [Gordonia insulae]
MSLIDVEGIGPLDPADPRARVRGPAVSAPPRRPGSVRRTTTIDMRWADGWGSRLTLDGRGRDLVTTGRDGVAIARSSMRVTVATDRRVEAITIATAPDRPGIGDLVGERAGSGFRRALSAKVGGVTGADPVDLMLDDIPGATLISGFAFAQWYPIESLLAPGAAGTARQRDMTGICTGFMPGSSGLAPDGTSRWTHRTRQVEPLEANDDPLAWHDIEQISELSMRRARRIDVWRDGRDVWVDSMFQDSSTRPVGGRIAVHEYGLTARIDAESMTLVEVTPEPHVLPYAECPLAVFGVDGLIGSPIANLRTTVLERLQGVAGCTHLNDALRALADVGHLVSQIR